jgi:hypothetical protein
LLDAAAVGEEAIEKYYDETAKYEAAAANSMEKQEVLWSNRMGLMKERELALKAIR